MINQPVPINQAGRGKSNKSAKLEDTTDLIAFKTKLKKTYWTNRKGVCKNSKIPDKNGDIFDKNGINRIYSSSASGELPFSRLANL